MIVSKNTHRTAQSSTCAVPIGNLSQPGSKENKIGLQGCPFVFYRRNIRRALPRRLRSGGSLLRLLFHLLKETPKVESFENSLSRLPRLASLSRIVNHCRGSGRILIRVRLFGPLLLSVIAGMLVVKMPVRRGRNVRERRGLMSGDDNLLG